MLLTENIRKVNNSVTGDPDHDHPGEKSLNNSGVVQQAFII